MKRTVALVGMVFGLFGGLLVAQAPPPIPKPAAEHQRLHYFVGEWKSEGNMKPSPWGPGGKFSSTDHNTMLGDFFVVLYSEGTSPLGPTKEVAVMGYDPKEKVYTYDGYTNMGEHDLSKGTISGNTWTWLSPEENMGGKKIKGRFIIKEDSATSFAYSYDISIDGGAWTNVMEGKATKVK
ncbi:MAG TPA: DUF1579 family protein [Terriglobales bacterium]|nr:DUF1579 family protein [Terriglobales bacterium]